MAGGAYGGSGAYGGNPLLGGSSFNEFGPNAAQVAGAVAGAAGTVDATKLKAIADQAIAQTQAGSAGNVAGIQAGSAGNVANIGAQAQRDVANTQGQYSLANTGLSGQYSLAGEGIKAGAGISEAEIAATPGLLQQQRENTKYNLLSPYVTGILGQVGPLISNIGSYLGTPGGGSGGGGPAAYSNASGGFNLPSGVNVPQSVITPGQGETMIENNTRQGNAGVLNDVNAMRTQDIASGAGTGSPLEQQLAAQMTAQNRAGLQNAATSFLGALAPANAQQTLGAGQLGELQRSNVASEQLKRYGLGGQAFGGLLDFVTGLAGAGTRRL